METLQAIHKAGFIHGNILPHNILVSEDAILLTGLSEMKKEVSKLAHEKERCQLQGLLFTHMSA